MHGLVRDLMLIAAIFVGTVTVILMSPHIENYINGPKGATFGFRRMLVFVLLVDVTMLLLMAGTPLATWSVQAMVVTCLGLLPVMTGIGRFMKVIADASKDVIEDLPVGRIVLHLAEFFGGLAVMVVAFAI